MKISFCLPAANNIPSFPCSIKTIYFSLHPIKLVHPLHNSHSNQLTYTFVGHGYLKSCLQELCDDIKIPKYILSKKFYLSGNCLLEPAEILESLIQMYLQVLHPKNWWSKRTQQFCTKGLFGLFSYNAINFCTSQIESYVRDLYCCLSLFIWDDQIVAYCQGTAVSQLSFLKFL